MFGKIQSSFLWFFIAYVFLVGFVLFALQKGTFELWLNQQHSTFLDLFFRGFDWVGDGVFFGLVVVGLAFYKYYYSLLALAALLLNSIVAQGLKRTIFEGTPRPKAFFPPDTALYYAIPPETVHSSNSFPSGHSTTAISVMLLLTIVFNNKILGVVFFFCALAGSLARVYLLQHFLVDTYAGMCIGFICTLLLYYYFEKNKALQQNTFWQKGIYSRKH